MNASTQSYLPRIKAAIYASIYEGTTTGSMENKRPSSQVVCKWNLKSLPRCACEHTAAKFALLTSCKKYCLHLVDTKFYAHVNGVIKNRLSFLFFFIHQLIFTSTTCRNVLALLWKNYENEAILMKTKHAVTKIMKLSFMLWGFKMANYHSKQQK